MELFLVVEEFRFYIVSFFGLGVVDWFCDVLLLLLIMGEMVGEEIMC